MLERIGKTNPKLSYRKTAKMDNKMFTENKNIPLPYSESAAEVAMECCN